MKIIIIAIGLLSSFVCLPIDNSYECIGLGETCTVAAALQMFQLRKAAYPLDWTICNYNALCSILQEDFKDFLNPNYLSIRADNHGIINKYGLVFVHDFPTIYYSGDVEKEDTVGENELRHDWINFLPEIQNKYERRIQRLRDVCISEKKIYFIRHGGIKDKQQACALRDILKKAYPYLDFILVIIGNDLSFEKPWEESHIKNYYLRNTTVWNDVAEWKNIFIDLGLLSLKSKAITSIKCLRHHPL